VPFFFGSAVGEAVPIQDYYLSKLRRKPESNLMKESRKYQDRNDVATSDIPAKLLRVEEASRPEAACAAIARVFHVQAGEVALLRIEKAMLKFLYPPSLSAAGMIPLSSPAVAARTAATKTSMLSNNFVKVRHLTIFEGVKSRAPENSTATEPAPIQKIMSVPVLDEGGKVLGVLQLSRKGLSASSAGPDFTNAELRQLEQAAALLSKKSFLL
jgi:hypothetical protein